MRVALCGYYGMDNAGDEALLASLLQMLPADAVPVVLSGNPSQTRARYGITACNFTIDNAPLLIPVRRLKRYR